MPLQASLRSLARDSYLKALGVEPLWRYGLNAGPTLSYRRNAPGLNAEAFRVLGDLNQNGAAQSSLEALTGDATLLGRLQELAAKLEAEKLEELERRKEVLASDGAIAEGYNKLFVLTLLDPDRPVIEPDGLLAQLMLHEQLKGIADSYYGMEARVNDINIWHNLPSKHEAVSSQLWHRDLPEDHMILKMFIYLKDVTEGAGPFSYIKGTHGKGDRSWAPANTMHDGQNVRATDEVMMASERADKRATFVAPAGTVLFADTFGWHKGGGATTDDRLVVQGLWASRSWKNVRMLAAPQGLDLKTAPRALAYANN